MDFLSLTRAAAATGQIDVLTWLLSHGDVPASNIHDWTDAAASSGSLNVIQWTYDLFNSADRPSWFPEPGPRDTVFSRRIFCEACLGGDISTLEWLYDRREVLKDKSNEAPISEAASEAKWEAVEWLRNKGFAIDECIVSRYAVQWGNLSFLKEARNEGLILYEGQLFFEGLCEEAAYNDKLEILKWLKKHGCPWSSDTTDRAAECQNFEILKWAIENGCPSTDTSLRRTLSSGDREMVEWLFRKGCPWPSDAVLYASSVDDSLVDWFLNKTSRCQFRTSSWKTS